MTLLELVTALQVDKNAAFQAQLVVQAEGHQRIITQCSAYVSVVCAARGVPMFLGTANEQHDWLQKNTVGWTPCDRGAAEVFAKSDMHTVVAAWKNTTPMSSGHIAVCVPPLEGEDTLFVSAAGKHCFVRTEIERSFGLNLVPSFFFYAPRQPEAS